MKTHFRRSFLLLLAGITIAEFASEAPAAEPLPNVVLIFVDDLGYGDLGCYGATKVQTPNIDRLAKEGRRFTDAHSASAVCTPSRYALLTGEYPIRANGGRGVWGPHPVIAGLLIDTNKLTIGKALQSKGYATACFGKWHLGFKEGNNDWKLPLRPGPQDVGFDYYFGIGVVNSAPPYVYVENDGILGHDSADPLVFGGKPVSPTPTFPAEASVKSPNRFAGALKAHQIYDDEKTGTLLTEKAVDWITENKEQPFFLYFSTPNIHHPMTPAPRFKGTSQCGLYGDFIHELDWMVGEVLQCLEQNGLSENTLVIFTSDNGGMLNLAGRNAMQDGRKTRGDLRSFTTGAWEGGHRVPFIARWPGKIEPGTESDQLICHVDLLATFTALTGQDAQALKGKDSINMLPALLEEPAGPLRTELLLAPHKQQNLGLRKGKWMYIGAQGSGGFTGSRPGDHAWGGPAAVQFAGSENSDIENGRIKQDAPPAQLYDLEADPRQTRNVYREYPEVVKEMEGRLNSYRSQNAQEAPGRGAPRRRPRRQAAQSTASEAKPNFIVIFCDDLGYQDLGCFGSPNISTPRIDRMAKEGMRFTSFYAQTVCGPSRAALMTGCYPLRLARQGDPNSIHPELHLEEITLAEVLQKQGYATAAIGKWDLAGHRQVRYKPELLPPHQGFEHFFGTPGSNDQSVNLIRHTEKIEDNADMGLLTRRYTDEALRFMETSKDAPFFLYLAHTMPHTKLAVSEEFKGKSKGGFYGDVVEEIDFNVGRVLDKVAELGLEENTYILFTSDNGPWLLRKEHGGRAAPLRSGKTSCWEGGLRVPCIVRAPGKIPAGTECAAVTATIDLLPTFAKLAGTAAPTDRAIDGVDISALMHGKAETLERSFFYYQHNCLRAVRSGRWKLMLPHTEPEAGSIARQWRSHIAPADAVRIERAQLYDLNADIGETTDVSSKHPEIVAQLMQLAEWARNDIGDHDRFGANARTFGAERRTLSGE